MQINAYAAYKPKTPLKPFLYQAKPLGPKDVVIDITHCGICHSDIHLMDGDWGKSFFPLVPGHEIVGIVGKKGKKVRHLTLGQRVGVGWQSGSCMHCEWCQSGQENLCPKSVSTCRDRFGGYARKIVTDSRFAFPIPRNISSAVAAPLLCAGVTVYSPLARWVKPGMKIGVIGIGGLGHLAIQFARAMKCKVTAFSHTPSKEKEVKKLGAHEFVILNEKNLRKRQKSLDFILSTVYEPMDWLSFVKILRPNGKLCFVGAVSKEITLPVDPLLVEQRAIVGSVIGGRVGIKQMLSFASRHGIKAQVNVMPLSKANEAVRKSRTQKARYRIVLDCQK